MANELKPCPFCGNEKPKLVDDRLVFYVKCDECKPYATVVYGGNYRHLDYVENSEDAISSVDWVSAKQSAIAAWNTRPASPVEGLDTALCIIQGDREERGIVLPVGTELVTRSQAEAIIAAERSRAEVAVAAMVRNHQRAEKAEAVIAAERAMRKYAEERIIQSERELKEARANNAALTARVKELEFKLSGFCEGI